MTEHKMYVSVDMVVSLDPERVEEYVLATYDLDEESVVISDLTEGNGVTAPIVFDGGPEPETIAWREYDAD